MYATQTNAEMKRARTYWLGRLERAETKASRQRIAGHIVKPSQGHQD